MKTILPSAVLILGCIAVASAQAPKPRTSDFFARGAGEAPPKPKASDFFARGTGEAPSKASAAPPAANGPPGAPIDPAGVTALGGDGLVAERVRYVSGRTTLTAARIEVRGTRLTREDLARLLDPAAPGDLRERLAAVKAREIVVPELAITLEPAGEGVATLRDIRLSDVGGGRIGSVVVGPGSAAFGEAAKPGQAAFARFEAGSVDADHLLAPFLPHPTDDANTLRSVFAGAALDGAALTNPNGDVVRIARIAAHDYRSRRTAAGLGATFDRIAAGLDKDADGSASTRGLAAAADLLGAFEIGSLEAVGLDYSDPRGTTGRIARIGLAAAAGAPGSVRLDGFEAVGPDFAARVAAVAVEDVSLRSLVDGMAAAGAGVGPAEVRRFVPQVGAIRLGRVAVAKGGSAAGAGSFSLDGLELATSDLVEGLPTRMRFTMRDLSVPVAAVSEQDPSRQLAGLGYTDIATSVRADLTWSEPSRQIAVHEIAVEGGGMGSATLRAVVGNVSKELFGRDPEVAKRAALGATAQSLDLDIQDRGLLDRILAAQASQQGIAAEDLRITYAAYARLGIPELLGTMPGGTELGQAVARFITKPGRLQLRAKATQPAGISAADIAATADPATLLGRIDLTATTE